MNIKISGKIYIYTLFSKIILWTSFQFILEFMTLINAKCFLISSRGYLCTSVFGMCQKCLFKEDKEDNFEDNTILLER